VLADRGGPRLRLTGRTRAAVARRAGGPPLLSLARAGEHALATVLLVPGTATRASTPTQETTA
jgi:hypothetical protein